MFKKYFITFFVFICSIMFLFSSFSFVNSSELYFPIRTSYIKTSLYGYRTLKTYHFHNGIDLANKIGTPIYALSSGTVTYIGFYSSYGNTVIISYYNGYKSLYGHLSSDFKVYVGQSVNSSTVVGTIGPKYLENGKLNGMTTGPHLHFTLYKNKTLINPDTINYIL